MENLLITGGAGFIGSNFIRWILKNDENVFVVNLDALTYAGNLENLSDVENSSRYKFVKGDIGDEKLTDELFEKFDFDGVINFAAESHVDRSILNSKPFIDTNVAGTLNLLEAAKRAGKTRFLQISTDEVYGSLGEEGYFTERTPLDPRSPYSASKAAADFLTKAYVNTYGLDARITRCSNNYGPYQFPEKLIPLTILNALEDKPLPIYGDGKNVRDWIYVDDHCEAIYLVYKKGKKGEVYNIGGRSETQNIEVAEKICDILGKPRSLIEFVKDRPGHDRRYAVDCSKIEKELGWKAKHNFDEGLKKTVEWYLSHREWSERARSGEYREYYRKQYLER